MDKVFLLVPWYIKRKLWATCFGVYRELMLWPRTLQGSNYSALYNTVLWKNKFIIQVYSGGFEHCLLYKHTFETQNFSCWSGHHYNVENEAFSPPHTHSCQHFVVWQCTFVSQMMHFRFEWLSEPRGWVFRHCTSMNKATQH